MHTHQRDFSLERRTLFLCAIAVLLGLLSTLAAFVLLNLIHFFTNLFFFQTFSFAEHSPAEHSLGVVVIAVPILGGLIAGLIARYGSEKVRGHGIPEAIEAILFRKSQMSPKVALLKPLTSGIVIGSGGPFGAEGPIIMTGGAIGSLVAQNFSVSAAERKVLLVAGATAGMTAIFGTPIAAVLLAIELLLFELRPRSLVPVVIACAVAGFARPLLIDSGPLFPMQTVTADWHAFGLCVIAGLLSGGLSAGMSSALYRVEDCFAKLPVHWMWWPAIGAIAVGVGGYFQPRALGVGYDVIADLLNNHIAVSVAVSILAVKAIIWLVALGSGTSGGVLAPLLMLGAGLGVLIASVFPGSDANLWPLVCMAAVLAGVLGAPLTATVFALGLTGDFNALLPLMLATGISYCFTILLMRRSIMTEKIARRGFHIFREYSVDPQERTFVSEVMSTQVVSIKGTEELGSTSEKYFGAQQRHRSYPVVNEQGQLLGMLDRECLNEALNNAGPHQPISAFIKTNALKISLPTENCQVVGRRMSSEEIERLPVVDNPSTMHLLGIVSRSDLIKPSRFAFHEEHVRERLWRQREG